MSDKICIKEFTGKLFLIKCTKTIIFHIYIGEYVSDFFKEEKTIPLIILKILRKYSNSNGFN